jgi:hypothetical protein
VFPYHDENATQRTPYVTLALAHHWRPQRVGRR